MPEFHQGPNLQPMQPSKLQPMQTTAYHVEYGPKVMYVTDARDAVARFPDEWSLEPWPTAEKAEAVALVTIPDDWRELSFPKRRQLAIKLGAAPTVRIADAEKIIAEEYARRVADAKQAEERNPRRPHRE